MFGLFFLILPWLFIIKSTGIVESIYNYPVSNKFKEVIEPVIHNFCEKRSNKKQEETKKETKENKDDNENNTGEKKGGYWA